MRDRFLHIFWGAFFTGIIAFPVYVNSHDLFAGLWACLAGVIAGGIKEFCYTNTDGNKWDWKDFLATVIGGVVVVLLILGLHYGRG